MSFNTNEDTDAGQALLRFLRGPGDEPVPERIAELFAPGLAPEAATRLLESPRLRFRAAALLATRLGDASRALAALEPGERMLILAFDATAAFARAASFAGAVWHAGRVRALVLRDDIFAFEKAVQFGTGARAMALRHSDLAHPADNTKEPLADIVIRDGHACLAAWAASLPEPIAARVRLRFPEGSQYGEALRDAANTGRRCRILRRIATEASAP
jgi:hypothetical protein